MPKLYFFSVDKALTEARRTARVLIKLYNNSGELLFSFSSFLWGYNAPKVEAIRWQIAFVTIEAPLHDAQGWAIKGV